MVRLSSSPVLHAECGTNSILKCEISSSKQGLSVKYMGWSLNDGSLCFVKENLTINYTHSLRRFHCMYSHGHLSLVLHDVQPQDGGNSTYVCKLRSNKGATHTTTRVEFKGQSAYLLLTLEWNKKTGRDEVFGYFFLGYFVWQRLYCLLNFLFSSPQNLTSAHGLAAPLEAPRLGQQAGMESDQSDP